MVAGLKFARQFDEIWPGLRSVRIGKHVVSYREEPGGILVSRVLPERMLLKGEGWKTKEKIETERSQNEKTILTLGQRCPIGAAGLIPKG
jgi:hypothetical protein